MLLIILGGTPQLGSVPGLKPHVYPLAGATSSGKASSAYNQILMEPGKKKNIIKICSIIQIANIILPGFVYKFTPCHPHTNTFFLCVVFFFFFALEARRGPSAGEFGERVRLAATILFKGKGSDSWCFSNISVNTGTWVMNNVVREYP